MMLRRRRRNPLLLIGGVPPSAELMAYEDLDTMAYEPDWLNPAFQQRIPLTINAGQVPSTQTDFPLLINDTYPDLIGEVEAELRFAGIDNIQLEYEIQKFDNITGELIAWVKKPTISDGDGVFIYFDNPGALDEQNAPAVWSNGYAAVYHLNNSFLDSTGNNNDLTNTATTDITGKIGQARFFDNVDIMTTISNSSLEITQALTLSAWIKPNTSSGDDGFIVAKDGFGSGRAYSLRSGVTVSRFGIETTSLTFLDGLLPYDNTKFNYIVGTYDKSFMRTYLDGNPDSNVAKTGDILIFTNDVSLGADSGGSGNFHYNGTIDEVRISNIARSDNYIETEFNNQNDTSTFYSTGTVESIPPFVSMGYEA